MMAHSIKLKITQGDLERLRCSICKGYLSCAPIRLLPDGSNICGRCTPSDNDVLVYREPALEVILNNATFPCMFKQFGCTTCLLFGQTTEHEENCGYRPITCVALPYTTCAWEGSIIQISDHFTDKHFDLVKQSAKFKFQIDKNIQGIQMVVKNNCSFIIKYLYDADTINLKYDVQCFTPNVKEEYCKLKLLNSLDPDYSMSLKGCKCVHYNHNFFVAENVTVLDLKKFLEILNNPTIIEIALTLPNYYFSSVAGLVVDYDLLSSKKCGKCQHYLIPPIYDYQKAIICSNCFYIYPNSTPFNDKELQDLLVDQNFPCRWRGCDFVAKGNTICSHEIECKYRVYSCAYFQSCNINLDQSKLIEHLVGHKYQYFVDVFTYKFRYTYNNTASYVFTIMKNEVVVIKYSLTHHKRSMQFYHKIEMKTSTLNPKQFAFKIYFEHNHCKCTSKTFTWNDSLGIYYYELPTCFKEDEELSVTLNVV